MAAPSTAVPVALRRGRRCLQVETPAARVSTASVVALVAASLGILVPVLVPSFVGLHLATRVRQRARRTGNGEDALGTVALALAWVGIGASLLVLGTFITLALTGCGMDGCDPDRAVRPW